ncbi:aldehyde dehydrogenase (acceptor) [Rhizobium sp. PP-F2F-G38]|uniref:Aldehyde dehydrogenase family protein n=1 Tax=Ferranicluibacter rubi TaxID=2715133 RepID=A0AA43ZG06_9HYPH|nr:aldehyde dehydrogenase family protein [Ferranicluibacter rubi]NHT77200.1 aldehyde dehydrogenase family protein [Ferranicluibacter rubi]PYE34205.1 aldehyde dehydrogenase (acceptor) [Rhizobium sp. PP-WC-1G-195]PYE96841.1 aldehyde dehydrogenase (acceptor) [Rhizobium sp. PP-F2F-G38]
MTLILRPFKPESEGAKAFLSIPRKRLLIGGAWVEASGGATFSTYDPATGEPLAELSEANASDVDAAVSASRAAFESDAWRGMTPSARAKLLWRIADRIEANADALAELETLDQGKSLKTGRFGEIPASAEQFRYYAGFATKILGTTIPTSIAYQPPGKKIFAYTTREPIGVVAAITPWNSPLLMAAMKLAPALAAGCTVVLKPAEETSLTALRLGELMIEAGLPAGVVNIVTGSGEVAGAALAAHPDVDKVAFTGSTEVGKLIVGAARGNLKKLTLELGGKSPAIVLADADMDLAVPGIARGIFANAGQVCVAGSRVYAHRAVYDRLVEGLAREADRLRLGHGLDPETDLGPLVNRKQADRVARYVRAGVSDGAEIVAGGVQDGEQQTFYAPTVVTGVRQDMALMREEIFGPVVAVTPFDEAGEALAFANDTPYGLAASVWTADLSTAHRLSAAIRSGTVWINCHSYFSPELPKGGHKQSGWGYENGAPGLENYLETKTVCALV